MARLGNEAKLILKLFEERIKTNNEKDSVAIREQEREVNKVAIQQRIGGREDALAILKSIHLEIMEE